MKSKASLTACVVGVTCFLGVAISPVAAEPPIGWMSLPVIKNHNGTRKVIVEMIGNGEMVRGGVALAMSFSGGDKPSMTTFISKSTAQTEVAMVQYNSAFATNYAQWMAKKQWVAAQNSQNQLQLATSRPNIQCQTIVWSSSVSLLRSASCLKTISRVNGERCAEIL